MANFVQAAILTTTVILLILSFIGQGLMASTSRTVYITNPRMTDFGDWGQQENCPEDQVVIGMQLMTEPFHGSYFTGGDDSALNGIKFFCGDPNSNESPKFTTDLYSKVGIKGRWGNEYFCEENQYARGFQMNSDGYWGYCDDTGASNLRLICAYLNGTLSAFVEGDGLQLGIWTDAQLCPQGQGMCSLKTQVGNEWRQREGVDETGLNNIEVACCGITPKLTPAPQVFRPAYA